jgi:hypothetical protein
LSDVLLLGFCCPFSQVVESVCRAVDTVLKADRVTGLRALANDKVVHLLSCTYQDAKRTADVEEAAAAGVVVRRRGPAVVCVLCAVICCFVCLTQPILYMCASKQSVLCGSGGTCLIVFAVQSLRVGCR